MSFEFKEKATAMMRTSPFDILNEVIMYSKILEDIDSICKNYSYVLLISTLQKRAYALYILGSEQITAEVENRSAFSRDTQIHSLYSIML